MTLTDKQRAERHKHLGASDVAAILGADHYRNAYDVWLEKTQRVTPDEAGAAADAGNRFEPGVLEWAEEQLGPLEHDETKLEVKWIGFPVVVHLDERVKSTGNPVEAKTAGLFGPLAEDWGSGNDEVPDRIIIQTHVQMGATNTKVCHVPAFLGGQGFKMYTVERDDLIFDSIQDAIIDFWKFVETDTPPTEIIPTLAFSKRIKREPKKVVQIDDQIVENWLSTKETLKFAKITAESAQAAVLAAMGDAEAGTCSRGVVTYFLQDNRRIDATRLRAEKPDIAVEYTKNKPTRVLRFKGKKKPK